MRSSSEIGFWEVSSSSPPYPICPYTAGTSANTSTSTATTKASRSVPVLVKSVVLFLVGCTLSTVVLLLQIQHQITQHPRHPMALLSTSVWIPLTGGLGSVFVGFVYPWMDRKYQRDWSWSSSSWSPSWASASSSSSSSSSSCSSIQPQLSIALDWNDVLRCLGGFLGVNYAASKLPFFSSDVPLSLSLSLISGLLWFMFDRSAHGLRFSLWVTVVGSVLVSLVGAWGYYRFAHHNFWNIVTCVPCLLFAGCITVGALGRKLAGAS